MLKEKANEVINALNFRHLTYEIVADSVVTFYYESNRYSRPIRLRSFHKNNFDKDNKFYIGIDDIVSKIKSDYIYIDNKPIIQ